MASERPIILPTLRALEARLAAATGPDRELDLWLAVAFGPNPFDLRPQFSYDPKRHIPASVKIHGSEYECFDASGNRTGWLGFHVVPALTGSVDAALALIWERLPDWGWFLRRDDTDADGKRAAPVYNAALLYPDGLCVTPGCGQAPTPALALCLALVRAEIAQMEGGERE